MDQAHDLASDQLRLLDDSQKRTQGITIRILACAHEAKTRPALLRQAIELLKESGGWLDETPAFIQSTTAELSEAERRVASLAALGHTNREIASSLWVTVSTVEQHLTRIYRKMGIIKRRELPSGLNA